MGELVIKAESQFSLNNNTLERHETSTTLSTDHPDFHQQTGRFTINMTNVFYNQGFINPGVMVDKLLGEHNEKMTVYFSDNTSPVATKINRTAMAGEAVRFVGRNRQIADWFKQHFKLHDVVQARILNPNAVLLLAPQDVDKY